jgi:D-glycero-D-manno-heptose 1,7-bisphosphate phosphatase
VSKAVFLDRDGTINIDKAYLHKIADFEFIPGTKEALARLRDAGYLLVIITNQSGVARGYYTEGDVRALHDWLVQALAKDGIHIAGVYYCPHHPDGSVEAYRLECNCRKPALGLFYRAASELDIDLGSSIAIGDRMRDLQICASSGCRGYLLGGRDSAALPANIKCAQNLFAAAEDIVAE